MFYRNIEAKILDAIASYDCLTLIGPRQSGKTTLCKKCFPDFAYYSFENPDHRDRFESDPRGILESIKGSVIFDEVQNVPALFSYLQQMLDENSTGRKFVLTGSNNLQLNQKVSQSLAGRTRILEVLPLELNEIPMPPGGRDLDKTLFSGAYPRIYDRGLDPTEWLGDYYFSYVEKDIRSTLQVRDLTVFNNFCRLLAGRAGQLVNCNALAGDAGVTHPTVAQWISVLQATYICFPLAPHFKNFHKRIIKSPKIYFYDTGLLCYLLRIRSPEQLETHPLRGQIFENWVIAETLKNYRNRGLEAPFYFWRDQHGHELDMVLDEGTHLNLFEIKSGKTFQKDFLKTIHWLNRLQSKDGGCLVYGGDERFSTEGCSVVPWHQAWIQ